MPGTLITMFQHLPIFDQNSDLLFITMEKENVIEYVQYNIYVYIYTHTHTHILHITSIYIHTCKVFVYTVYIYIYIYVYIIYNIYTCNICFTFFVVTLFYEFTSKKKNIF